MLMISSRNPIEKCRNNHLEKNEEKNGTVRQALPTHFQVVPLNSDTRVSARVQATLLSAPHGNMARNSQKNQRETSSFNP